MASALHLTEDTSAPEKLTRWALKKVDTGERIAAVEGRTGAGRSRLIDSLRRAVPNLIVVEPPPLSDGDAVFHALAQLAVAAGRAGEAYESGARSVCDRAHRVGARLAEGDRLVVLRLPSSWNALDASTGHDQLVFRRRALDLMEGLRRATSLRIIVLTTRVDRALSRALGLHGHIEQLPVPELRPASLRDEAAWGAYAPHAGAAADLLSDAPKVTPIEARLLVGCLALGAPPARLLVALASSSPLGGLLSLLRDLLAEPAHRAIASGLAAPLAARRALPIALAEELSALPEEHRLLLRECVGHCTEDGALRVSERVRLALGAPQPIVHGRLAAHYEQLDGKGSIAGLDPASAVSWLEKVHHLAHGGPATAATWAAQTREARELYWDRGRALSLEMERYGEAADVYRECVQQFADDAYAWHYLGFNLDRAGIAPLEAEAAFRKAATIEPDNRWWHSRLVTFLVEQAQYDDAEAAIRAALDVLDPEGARARTDVQLVLDFHRWVVTAWLDAGEIARAGRIFDLVRGEGGEAPCELRVLGWRLADAEEAEWLGDSVHPPGVSMGQRWVRPLQLSERGPDATRLVAWFPARVVEASEEAVTLVVGVPAAAGHALVRTVVDAAEWRAGNAWCPAEEASGYLYLVRYESGVQRFFQRDEPAPPWETAEPTLDPLRHLRGWASTTGGASPSKADAASE